MNALIGEMPPSLVQRERDMRHWRWTPAAMNPHGQLCDNVADFYGGPFFTDDGRFWLHLLLTAADHFSQSGKFVHDDLIPRKRNLESELPQEEDVNLFVNFMKRMLCWIPEERATAAELLSDPWLDRGRGKSRRKMVNFRKWRCNQRRFRVETCKVLQMATI